jgi:hypothetical protein
MQTSSYLMIRCIDLECVYKVATAASSDMRCTGGALCPSEQASGCMMHQSCEEVGVGFKLGSPGLYRDVVAVRNAGEG